MANVGKKYLKGKSKYHDNTGMTDIISGGVKMIPISTPIGDF